VSLQGTLDSFPVPEILRFLGAGKKTGRLVVNGPRGGGDVWLDDGSVVAIATANVDDPPAALFELLREPDGGFEFLDDLTRSDAASPLDVEGLLATAEARLAEWREIEAVVPSLAAAVDLVAEVSPAGPATEVRLDPAQWRMVVAVAHEATVGGVGDRMSLNEFDTCRALKDLVEEGLVAIGGEQEAANTLAGDGRDASALAAKAELSSVALEPGTVDVSDPAPDDRSLPNIPSLRVVDADTGDREQLTDEEMDRVAERIAEMGPEAKQAVQAAVRAATPEERDRALSEVGDDDAVDRGLLLKFLSSVRT